MSVYNGRPFLEEAVQSVLAQTYSDVEFIIIDDGSTDGSTELLHAYADRGHCIRLFVQANRGLTPSLNRGLKQAQGKYIARIDDDDVALPGRFAAQVDYLDAHPQCVAVGGQVAIIDERGRPLVNRSEPPYTDQAGHMEGLWDDHASIEKGLLEGKWPILQSAIMMRREAVEIVGGYDERFATNQDHDLFLKLAEVGQLANIPDTVVKYRRHESQVTAQSDGRNFSAAYRLKKIRREAHQRRGLPLPPELSRASLAGTALRREFSKSALWPYIQKAWGVIRSSGVRAERRRSHTDSN
jgi:glycosyltransferase involved in cell wall biosynthesis